MRCEVVAMVVQADHHFRRAAEASPRNPYVYLSWGQMRFQHCRSAGGAREIFARGAEVCPKCAPNHNRTVEGPPYDAGPQLPSTWLLHLVHATLIRAMEMATSCVGVRAGMRRCCWSGRCWRLQQGTTTRRGASSSAAVGVTAELIRSTRLDTLRCKACCDGPVVQGLLLPSVSTTPA